MRVINNERSPRKPIICFLVAIFSAAALVHRFIQMVQAVA